MIYCDLNTKIDVGASAHYLEIGSFRIMVDCGLDPKLEGNDAIPNIDKITDDTLDIICVTHAHLDHCAYLPVLAKRHPHALIFANKGGAELIVRMLRNSRAVMIRQRDEAGIKEYPFYSHSDIDDVRSRLIPMQNEIEKVIERDGETLKISFWRAGHIPGAASVLIEHNRQKILFSGDISFRDTQLLKGAKPPVGKVDVLVCESTRGTTQRPANTSYFTEVDRLLKEINNTLKEDGSVLIPAFALGRMQEILLLIQKAKAQGAIPKDTPIFASGLGVDIAEQMIEICKKSHHFSFSKQAMEGVKAFRQEITVGQDLPVKGIYILGSGMLVPKTPSYLACSALLAHKTNAIFFVGYCDPDTAGGKLLQAKQGESFTFPDLFYSTNIYARIDKFDLSSHADRDEVLSFILEKDPRCLILTHGSEESREYFMDEMIDLSPKTQIIIPELSELTKL
ncbi:MAG: MBL fold metallo-hydrolase [Opitutales bacterium]